MRQVEFERLYVEHAQRLFGFLVYRTGDRDLAEDVLADAFEQAYRARERYDPRRASSVTWLYAIALNRLRDHQRRRGAEGRAYHRAMAVVPAAETDARLELVGTRDALARALERLTDEEREAVALRFGADLPVRQIATVLGVRETTAEGRVYRALRKLRAELGFEE